jgi:pimeloyl-ACP methyl ester carboxylesterase
VLDPEPEDDAEWTAWLEDAEAFAAGCEEQSGDLLPFLDSESTARDIDAIREALGHEQINLMGFSTGLSSCDPSRSAVRAFVLDAPWAPGMDVLEAVRMWAWSYEDALDRFFTWCGDATPEACAFHGGQGADAVGIALRAILAAVDEATITAAEAIPTYQPGI